MPNQYGGTTDTEWALGFPLDRLNTIDGARLAIRYLRKEVERLEAENQRLRERPRGMQIGDGNTQTNTF